MIAIAFDNVTRRRHERRVDDRDLMDAITERWLTSEKTIDDRELNKS